MQQSGERRWARARNGMFSAATRAAAVLGARAEGLARRVRHPAKPRLEFSHASVATAADSPSPRSERSAYRIGKRFLPKSLVLFSLLAACLSVGAALAYYVRSDDRAMIVSHEISPEWASVSHVRLANLATTGKNAYFNLEPGYRLRYADGVSTRTMTVLRKVKIVDGVETRVVQEREEKDGRTVSVVWKYYAIDKTSNDVYCFGIHAQTYQDGRIVAHRGWRSGVHGAIFSLAMPAAPKVGDSLTRGTTKKRYEVVELGGRVVTPAGSFTNCLRVRIKDDSRQEIEDKFFAPHVGLVKNGDFALVKIVHTVPPTLAQQAAD